MADHQLTLPHTLTLNDRRELAMTGVTEVVRFDDTAVVLRTGSDLLVVEGKDLQLKTLSPEGGKVAVAGAVDALIYQSSRQERSLWQRLFP